MTLLIGIDEAGYGPNLGPLCIGATAWLVERQEPDDVDHEVDRDVDHDVDLSVDLYGQLADIVSCRPDGQRIAIADSKQLYKPSSHANSSGLRHLERGVLTALAALGRSATCWQSLLTPPALPWYADFNCPLPVDASTAEVTLLAERFLSVCDSASVQLIDLCTRVVYPQEFNELTEQYGSKGAALSHVSMELLKSVLNSQRSSQRSSQCSSQRSSQHNSARNSQRPTHNSITCDKHGGRNRYAALLQHHFPDESIAIIEESRPRSRYRWGQAESPTEIIFRSKGEAELPVALASMAAKYHRELAMRAFNAFWIAQIPALRPTAGYPQDAKRFKAEIAALQSKLGIDDHILWRNR